MKELWNSIATGSGRTLSDDQLDQFARFLDLLDAANATMNLTRITDRPAAQLHHIADSLTLLVHIPTGTARLADVGSGGGLPGIPLAIALPDTQVHLIESTRKKVAFLSDAVSKLGLSNVHVISERAEDVGRGAARETFNIVTARAVGALDVLAEYCLPLLRRKGTLLAMKGPRVTDELPVAAKPIKILGGGVPVVHPVVLPGVERHVIVAIEKIGRTSDRFPRHPSQKGRPLC